VAQPVGPQMDVLIFDGAFTYFSEVDMSEEYYYEFKIRCCAHPFPMNNGKSNTQKIRNSQINKK
jgi:hypothetical protein